MPPPPENSTRTPSEPLSSMQRPWVAVDGGSLAGVFGLSWDGVHSLMAFGDTRKPLKRSPFKRRSPMKAKPKRIVGFTLAAKGETQCRACGRTAHDPHHAAPRSLSPAGRADLRNCLPLCRDCHDAFHNGTPLPRSVFHPDELAFVSSLVTASWLDARYPEVVEVQEVDAPEVRW